eukprot:3346850-Lingulodinium_polyedra.AAC.1
MKTLQCPMLSQHARATTAHPYRCWQHLLNAVGGQAQRSPDVINRLKACAEAARGWPRPPVAGRWRLWLVA